MDLKIGLGVDYHQFSENRPLILGGIRIPFHKGLAGHSDADVVLHAIADAMLGALALGDIGFFFPNTDPQWKDVDSMHILSHTYKLIQQQQFTIGNIDVMVSIEVPKLSPHILAMREKIATALEIDLSCVSIKTTTTEKMGFVGREEGAIAHSVVLLQRNMHENT